MQAANRPVLFDAFEKVSNGHLTIVTPDKSRMDFGPSQSNLNANWKLHDWNVLSESLARGEIGFAETYIEQQWDSDDLAGLVTFMLLNSETLEQYFHGKPWYWLWLKLMHWMKPNSLSNSKRNVQVHYDLGNDFYALWLDSSMTYSCGLFEGNPNRTLEEAQAAKYERILSKLNAKPDAHILEIGCGWGGFAAAAARKGVRVTGITLSTQQADYARQKLAQEGLDTLASIDLRDYRQMVGKFDHIVSIGMFEHVGERYWPIYFSMIRNLLKPGGKAMVQTITLDDQLFEKLGNTTGFIEKYIFPGGMLPSKKRFRQEAEKAGLNCKEFFAFGKDYARTLNCWLERFEAKLPEVKALGYDERFIRIWKFYLSSCIASFASERTDVMQAELTIA